MKKIMLVFGTRPEAIKMAPLILEFKKYPEDFQTLVCVTGQHREMLDQVLNFFGIVPDYDLNIMKQGQDLYDVTSKVLLGMRNILDGSMPDLVFVHGDTTTSMATSIAAYYKQIKVAHVEAGLRTNNIYSPWPEELNRQITGRIASVHFSPTETSKNNLLLENVDTSRIFVTGNTVIDALQLVASKIKTDSILKYNLKNILEKSGYNIDRLNDSRKLVLITCHRRENFGKGLENICLAIRDLANKYSEIDFVFPMHLNPNVRNSIKLLFGDSNSISNLFFIEPLEYLSFVFLMEKSYFILTDSGGIQEEAPGIKKPVLVMRDTTERPEAIEAGTVKLVGTDYNTILSTVSRLLDEEKFYQSMINASNPYGDGFACRRIVKIIKG